MIQVDLEALKARFYNYGKGRNPISTEDAAIYASLDQWQRKELVNAMVKGTKEVAA